MTESPKVLLLEDDDFDAAVTRELLEKCCRQAFAVDRCKLLSEACKKLSREEFRAVLVDMNLPDSAGLETVREIHQVNPETPIVVLTGTDDANIAVAALGIGAQDYLPKTALDSRALERVIEYSVSRKQKENDLTTKAYYDSLTGLGNRALLYDRWRRGLSRSRRAERLVGVLVVDIDDFKSVNDTHGHEAGDLLLMHLSERLKTCVRNTDIVARLGGDEFVIVLENVRSKREVDGVRDKLMNNDSYSLATSGKKIAYSVSIGSAIIDPDTEEDLMHAMRAADAEMYQFKAKSKARMRTLAPANVAAM